MNKFNISAIVLSLAAIALIVVHYLNSPRIAFVRINHLIQNYKGTDEAFKELDAFKEKSSKGLDSLNKNLSLEIENYKRDSTLYSKDEKLKRKEKIRNLQYSIYQLQGQLEEEYSKRDNQLSLGVMNQVNEFIKKFAAEKGYDILLGTNESSTILFGTPGYDATDELLQKLNAEYKGE